ncbi:AAC(3) family N-acetyltransferase [Streptomyces himalayensis]|uniref:AAC(3) family N-acetyltransferase n=1 Tax=Streptomyces himalayensis TaxID=2820085 RepID=UPI002867D6E9|nr:AAC(3) family N-acetyltransferase [Streptomyces himalayensis]
MASSPSTCDAHGAYRSAHPQTSFAVIGRRATWLMDGHDPRCHLGSGRRSKLYAQGARVTSPANVLNWAARDRRSSGTLGIRSGQGGAWSRRARIRDACNNRGCRGRTSS